MLNFAFIKKSFLYLIYKLFYKVELYWLLKGRFITCNTEVSKANMENIPFILKGIKNLNNSLIEKEYKDSLIQEAGAIYKHKFIIFGKEVEFKKNINWHLSENGGSWPNKRWYRITLDSKKLGDVKYTWELNRHQHLTTLGRAYFYTKDEKFANEYRDEILQWIKSNPVEYGINWASGLEIALRAISWIASMDFFYPFFEKDKKFINLFSKEIWYSGMHIYKNLFYTEHLMRNNHLIGESVGLLIISLYFDRKGEANKWFNKSLKILKRESERQIRKDGSSIEESSSYEVFSLYLLLIAVIAMRNNKINVPNEIMESIERGANFIRCLVKPNGELAKYGDCDDAKAIILSNNNQISDVLNLSSVIFNKPDLKVNINHLFPENILFLLGAEALEKWNKMKNLKEKYSKHFPEGKIGVINKNDIFFFVRFGNISEHAHADIGHFLFNLSGEDIIVDSGTYKYNTAKELRNYFRSTKTHNTLTLNGINQSLPVRTFSQFSLCKTVKFSYDKVDEFTEFYGTYQCAIKKRVFMFSRKFIYHPDGLIAIIDRINGNGNFKGRLYFHLDPLVAISLPDKNIVKLTSTGNKKDIFMLSKSCNGKNLEMREKDSWISPSYGIKLKSSVLNFSYDSKLPLCFITLIYWNNNFSSITELLMNRNFLNVSGLSKCEISTLAKNNKKEIA
jgi:hypothetical protein